METLAWYGTTPVAVGVATACGIRAAKLLGAEADLESEASLIVVCVPLDLGPNVKAGAALGLTGAAEEIFATGICGIVTVTDGTVSEVAVATAEETAEDALASLFFADDVCFRCVSEVEPGVSALDVSARRGATPPDPSSISVAWIDFCACPFISDETTLSTAADDEAVLPNEFTFWPSGLKTDAVAMPSGVSLDGADTGFSPRFEFVAAGILDPSDCGRGTPDALDGSDAFARG